MKTVEIKLFDFAELNPDAQKKALENFAYINVEDDNEWHNNSIESFKTELAEVGFSDAKIFYSGFSSQGDGLCFDANIDVNKFAETTNEKRIAKLINNDEIGIYEIKKTSGANHHSHKFTRYIDTPFVNSVNKCTNIHSIINALDDKINTKRLELCEKFYRALETEFYGLISEESVKATIEANKYTFLENGEFFNL